MEHRFRSQLRAWGFAATAAITLGVATGAAAQPFKCRDPQGRTTYSDAPCPTGADAGRVNTTNSATIESPQRARELRQQQDATVKRIEQSQQAENARQRAASQESSLLSPDQLRASCREQVGRRAPDLSARQQANLELVCSGLRESLEKAQLDSCLDRIDHIRGLSAYQEAQSRAGCHGGQVATGGATGLRPQIITSCDPGGCWDNLGNRYNGTGSTLFRQDGTACQKVGNELQCRP